MYLERITILLEIAGQKGAATVADFCTHSLLPKPTVYRLVQDLVAGGLLDEVSKGRFAPGARLRQITQSDQTDEALRTLISPTLKTSANEHGAAFFLSRLRGGAVEIIHVEPPVSGVSYLHPGLGRRPIHACSCAKAVAAFCPEPMIKRQAEGRLKAYTEHTITQVADLDAELADIRVRGYAECVEEIERGMCSVAAPLAQSGLGATMAIGATGSVRVFDAEFRANIGPTLSHLALELGSRLNTHAPAA